jgi:hypothetical protein
MRRAAAEAAACCPGAACLRPLIHARRCSWHAPCALRPLPSALWPGTIPLHINHPPPITSTNRQSPPPPQVQEGLPQHLPLELRLAAFLDPITGQPGQYQEMMRVRVQGLGLRLLRCTACCLCREPALAACIVHPAAPARPWCRCAPPHPLALLARALHRCWQQQRQHPFPPSTSPTPHALPLPSWQPLC